MSFVPLTGRVGVVRPPSEVVLQQLVSPGGTGSGHQPHCGLMKEHLQETQFLVRRDLRVFVFGTQVQKEADAPIYIFHLARRRFSQSLQHHTREHFPVSCLKQRLLIERGAPVVLGAPHKSKSNK